MANAKDTGNLIENKVLLWLTHQTRSRVFTISIRMYAGWPLLPIPLFLVSHIVEIPKTIATVFFAIYLTGLSVSVAITFLCALAMLVVLGMIFKSRIFTNEHTTYPPRFTTYLLSCLVSEEHRQDVLGDLEEDFLDKQSELGHKAAAQWYYWQVLTTICEFLLDIGRRVVKWVVSAG